MSWLVTKINNETHEVSLRHEDGTESSFVVPESERYPSAKKHAYIKSQVKPIKATEPVKKPIPWLIIMAVAELIAIVALMLRH